MDRAIDLEELAREYSIIADWSAFLHPEAGLFWNSFTPILAGHRKKILISLSAQLGKQSSSSDTMAYSLYGALKDNGLIEQFHFGDNPSSETLLNHIITQSRTADKICLIAQNPDLVRELTGSVTTGNAHLMLCHISHQGTLLKIDVQQGKKENYGRVELQKFRLMSEPRNLKEKDTALSVRTLPALNNVVKDGADGRHVLTALLGCGGEGSVFQTDTGRVCKIYHREKLTVHKREKIKLMASHTVPSTGVPAGICWPEEMAFNGQGEFVGYLMSPARGKKLQTALMVGKMVMSKQFPHWTRKNLVTLCKTILEKIQYLHEKNILMGDINPQNILLQDDTHVCFVDTDSYQIEDFPCPVGTNNFTAPEIQGREFRSFQRTFSHEHFAVATLIFMILLPGKTPYSHEGCGDPTANIKKMHFSYPFGEKRSDRLPPGPWRYIWSHLTYKLKEAFFRTFHSNQQKWDSEGNCERLSTSEWLQLINSYLFSITEGFVSDELFPVGLKEVNDYSARRFNKLQGERKKCIKCQNDYFHPREKGKETLAHTLSSMGYCRRCVEVLRNNPIQIRCGMCTAVFLFSQAEALYYRQIGYERPRYCSKCRNIKRELWKNKERGDLYVNNEYS